MANVKQELLNLLAQVNSEITKNFAQPEILSRLLLVKSNALTALANLKG